MTQALYAHMNNKTIKKNKAIKKKLEVLINYSGLKSDIEKVTSNIFLETWSFKKRTLVI
jgi:hypothetical protein